MSFEWRSGGNHDPLDGILSACATVLAETIAMASATEQETQSMLATVKGYLDAAVSLQHGIGK